MKEILKSAREQKNIKTRELAKQLAIDQALISKFENGNRMPTSEQVSKLAEALDIDYETLLTLWLKEKILEQLIPYECGEKALKMALDEIRNLKSKSNNNPINTLQALLKKIDFFKNQFNQKNNFDHFQPSKIDEINFIFHLLRWSNHSFTKDEIEKFIFNKNKIEGKSMKEHLEVSNTKEVLRYLHLLLEQKFELNESELITIHQLINKNLIPEEEGTYRKTTMLSSYFSTQTALADEIRNLIEDLFKWYEQQKSILHPIELATSFYLKFLTIQPFSESNDKIASLIFTYILCKNGYGFIFPDLNTFSKIAVEKALLHNDNLSFYINVLTAVKNHFENILEN